MPVHDSICVTQVDFLLQADDKRALGECEHHLANQVELSLRQMASLGMPNATTLAHQTLGATRPTASPHPHNSTASLPLKATAVGGQGLHQAHVKQHCSANSYASPGFALPRPPPPMQLDFMTDRSSALHALAAAAAGVPSPAQALQPQAHGPRNDAPLDSPSARGATRRGAGQPATALDAHSSGVGSRHNMPRPSSQLPAPQSPAQPLNQLQLQTAPAGIEPAEAAPEPRQMQAAGVSAAVRPASEVQDRSSINAINQDLWEMAGVVPPAGPTL